MLLDANVKDPGEARFEDEELWSGELQKTAGISPALVAHVAAKTKEKAEIEKQRAKAKEVRKGLPAAPKAGAKGGPG